MATEQEQQPLMIQCPLCEKPGELRLVEAHLSTCRKRTCNTGQMTECPFNLMHVISMKERSFHVIVCADRHLVPDPDAVVHQLESMDVDADKKNIDFSNVGDKDEKVALESTATATTSKSEIKTPAVITSFNSLPPNQLRQLQNQYRQSTGRNRDAY